RDLIALDQLARLLHAGADVVGRILHQQLDRPAEDAALFVDVRDRELGAGHLVLRGRRIDAGEWVDEADAHGRFAARRDDGRPRDLQGAGRGRALEHGATTESGYFGHGFSSDEQGTLRTWCPLPRRYYRRRPPL